MRNEKKQARTSWEEDRHKLAEWLAEWEIECRLAENDRYEEAWRQAGPACRPDLYADCAVADGEVWLLKPVPDSVHPVYVSVLVYPRSTLWIPYSRFATPALPGEFLTHLNSVPLRVLCGWNAVQIPSGPSAGGPACWRVQKLTKRQRDEQERMWRISQHQIPVDDSLRRRAGPPLQHPADPRHDYIDAERARIGLYFPVRPNTQEQDVGSSFSAAPFLSETTVNDALRLAAEDHGRYQTRPRPNDPPE